MTLSNARERFQCWVALVLTTGEFGCAIWIIFNHHSFLYLYLAFTTLARETTGGRHYHQILIDLFHRNKRHEEIDDECRDCGV